MSDDFEEAEAEVYTPPAPKKRTDDELDMTPMVDVTFLLLIFFMVTAAFAVQKVLNVPPIQNDEEASTAQVDEIEKDMIIVKIDADNIFWITAPIWPEADKKAVSSVDMRAKVREAKEGGSGTPGPNKMMVQAHEDAVYEKLVDAIDAGSAAMINEISVDIVDDESFGL